VRPQRHFFPEPWEFVPLPWLFRLGIALTLLALATIGLGSAYNSQGYTRVYQSDDYSDPNCYIDIVGQYYLDDPGTHTHVDFFYNAIGHGSCELLTRPLISFPSSRTRQNVQVSYGTTDYVLSESILTGVINATNSRIYNRGTIMRPLPPNLVNCTPAANSSSGENMALPGCGSFNISDACFLKFLFNCSVGGPL
jgi:hypothetical protein